MKLRIRGNSVRLRLARSEVERFKKEGLIGEIVEFEPTSPVFRYELRTTDESASIAASFDDNCLTISVPISKAKIWMGSQEVGIEAAHPIGDGKFLNILIEKDFACLTPRESEDESDAFTNPLAHSVV
ncbi:MAG: hypothetical protein ABI539_14815 [Acidobacteriota bacterium]